MRKLLSLLLILGLLIGIQDVVRAEEITDIDLNTASSARIYKNVEEGLYKVFNYGEKGQNVYLEVKRGNEEPIIVFIGTGERYINLTGDIEYVYLVNTDILKVDEIIVIENNKATEGVYVVGKDLKAGTYTFKATTEYCGIVQKLTTLEVAEGIELGDVYFIEAGEEVEVKVMEGEILQVIQAEGK